jgi:hypothetical protein
MVMLEKVDGPNRHDRKSSHVTDLHFSWHAQGLCLKQGVRTSCNIIFQPKTTELVHLLASGGDLLGQLASPHRTRQIELLILSSLLDRFGDFPTRMDFNNQFVNVLYVYWHMIS